MAPRGEQSDQKRDQRSPRPPHRSKSEPVLVSRAAVNMKGTLRTRRRKSVTQLVVYALILLVVAVVCLAMAFTTTHYPDTGVFCNDRDVLLPRVERPLVPAWLIFLFGAVVLLFSSPAVDLVNFLHYRNKSVYLHTLDKSVKRHALHMKLFLALKSLITGLLNVAVTCCMCAIMGKQIGALSPDFVHLCFQRLEDVVAECNKARPDKSMPHWPVFIPNITQKCTRNSLHKAQLSRSMDNFPSGLHAFLYSAALFHLTYISLQLRPVTARYLFLIWEGVILLGVSVCVFSDLSANRHALRDSGGALLASVAITLVLYTFLHLTKQKELQDLERTLMAAL